jgi:glycosyltransferase involved in cell wall biosynthesis
MNEQHDRIHTYKLLLVGNFLSASHGTRLFCEDLAVQLRERGHQIVCTSSKPKQLHRLVDMCKTVWTCRNVYDFAVIDVFSGPSFYWAATVATLLQMLNKPYVLVLHGGGLKDYHDQHPKRVTALLHSATVVVTPSQFLCAAFATVCSDIQYLPNALPIDRYPYTLKSSVQPNLTWLRGFHVIYNPLLAVQTVELLKTMIPDIHLTMYGPDKGDGSRSQVIDYIAEKKLTAEVSLKGVIPKSEVPNSLITHDIFLNTTRLESFGVCVAEAAACGLPVVSTCVGEIPYLWKDGIEALLVPEGDAEAMASAVRRILTEHDLARSLSLNARAKVEQFDWNNVLPMWEKLFSKITRGKCCGKTR